MFVFTRLRVSDPMPGISAWGTMPGILKPGMGRAPGRGFESNVARHGVVQIKSQPAFDGTFLFPIPGFHPVWGGAAAAMERAATDKTLNPVNCACTRVSRAPISARSLSLLLRDRRSCLCISPPGLPSPTLLSIFPILPRPMPGFKIPGMVLHAEIPGM